MAEFPSPRDPGFGIPEGVGSSDIGLEGSSDTLGACVGAVLTWFQLTAKPLNVASHTNSALI